MNFSHRADAADRPYGQAQDADSHCKSGRGVELIFRQLTGRCMRSAEASGVKARGVDSHSTSSGGHTGLLSQLHAISPLSYLLAVLALLAATLFVVIDMTRSFELLRQRQALVAQLASAQPLLARQFAAGSFSPVVSDISNDAVTAAITQRAAAAYGMALLMILLGIRRRPVRDARAAPSSPSCSSFPTSRSRPSATPIPPGAALRSNAHPAPRA